MWTGLINFKVVGVNPTPEEAEKIAGRPIKIPDLKVTDQSGEKFKITFLLKSEKDFYMTKTFSLKNELRPASTTGKFQFINGKGQTNWAENEASLEFRAGLFDDEKPIRKVYVGEADLVAFCLAYLEGTPTDDNTVMKASEFDAMTDLGLKAVFTSGRLDKLRNFFKEYPGSVNLLVSIRDYMQEGKQKFAMSISTNTATYKSGRNTSVVSFENYMTAGKHAKYSLFDGWLPVNEAGAVVFTAQEHSLEEVRSKFPSTEAIDEGVQEDLPF